ncbi:transcription antitermination factor NusB [Ancylobacter mangrovi]|uniref:transcription antitermination factor NusB n=1 Tax=Ancylobacter mangrovi TaxID=2972472 RepID=UPI002163CE9B|nr:transcription antitermination factor NusB [Ancylobacter mangrovi]MCS0503516.1 transcription antitermination factor NusB [Ancylobacter mangrovi]
MSTAKPTTAKPAGHKPVRKSAARLNAVQALYQMDVAATPLPEILAQFESHWIGREIEGDEIAAADVNLFRDIVSGVVNGQRTIDPVLDAALVRGWPLKRIEAVLRAVLRAGAYELASRPDVPARVVVAEYVNVAAAFLDREETGMVNAVLDGLAREHRPGEFTG